MKRLSEGGFLISKIKQITGRIFTKKLKLYGIDLNPAQGRIIYSLWQNDNVPINELARRTALGKTTLTSMLERLEKSGFIIRKEDAKDSRKTLISLSEKTKSLESRHEAVSKEMDMVFYHGLSEKEINDFEVILGKILSNLVNYEQEQK